MQLRLGDIRLRRYPVGYGMILIWALGALGLAVAIWRFVAGLGPTTNLSDGRGWGIWIVFDMISGIGLAAGAFTVAAAVYIFNIKKLFPIVRPTILTGFISYILGALTILADLGFPQRIFNMLIYWNIHSPLFEIGVCVMTYTTVLALEFSPAVFEALHWKVPIKIIHSIQIPLIVAGIVLSTMHQSTLGTMFTILPYRVHPLWYSLLQPLYFYLTAIAAGIAMTVFESYHSARTYCYKFEIKILARLTKAIPFLLGLYLLLKAGDLLVTGNYILLFKGDTPSILYLAEMCIGVIIPIWLFADPKIRNHPKAIVWAATLIMFGLIFNRFNVGLINFAGDLYIPAWSEIAVSVGLTCLGFIMYDAAVRFLPMFPECTPKTMKEL